MQFKHAWYPYQVVLQVNVAFIVDAFANAQKIKNVLSKNSTSDQNYHSNHANSKMGKLIILVMMITMCTAVIQLSICQVNLQVKKTCVGDAFASVQKHPAKTTITKLAVSLVGRLRMHTQQSSETAHLNLLVHKAASVTIMLMPLVVIWYINRHNC